MGVRFQHPESEWEAQVMLERLGCTQPAATAATGRLLPMTLILISTAAIGLAIWAGPYLHERMVDVDLGHLLLALGVVAAVVQWRATVEQQSMEKYEHEIAHSNELVTSVDAIPGMMPHHYPNLPHEAKPNIERVRYVYHALDSLEYALERYRCGLSSAYATSRAVMTFENRCESPEFRNRIKLQVRAASYSPVVHVAVARLIERF